MGKVAVAARKLSRDNNECQNSCQERQGEWLDECNGRLVDGTYRNTTDTFPILGCYRARSMPVDRTW